MAISLAQLATDLGNVIADLPTTFTYAGADYTGSFTTLTVGHNLEAGGFVNDFAGSITAKQSAFSILPTAGVTVGIGGVVYRVAQTIKSPAGDGIQLDLVTPDK